MSFSSRPTIDLVRIAESGAGLSFKATSRPTIDLVRIAEAAKAGGSQLILTGMSARPTIDLVRIGEAGQGHVCLED